MPLIGHITRSGNCAPSVLRHASRGKLDYLLLTPRDVNRVAAGQENKSQIQPKKKYMLNGQFNGQLIPATSNRVLRSLALRTQTAGADSLPLAPAQIDNGDEALYADKSGTYTKGVLQSGIGLVDLAAYQS